MNNDDKEMLRLYHQAMGQVEKISVETQVSERIEDQYKQAIESIGLNPEFVFSDDAKRIYVLKIVQDEKGQYKYRKSYIDYNSFTKNFDTLTKNNIKDYIAKNRYMVNPILVNRYGFYVRPNNWTGFELPDQEFTKEKVFIDIKKRIIYVYNAIPEPKTDFNVVGAFLIEILDRNEYKLFMQWLALYVFESRSGLRKPILIITGKFWTYIRDILEAIYPDIKNIAIKNGIYAPEQMLQKAGLLMESNDKFAWQIATDIKDVCINGVFVKPECYPIIINTRAKTTYNFKADEYIIINPKDVPRWYSKYATIKDEDSRKQVFRENIGKFLIHSVLKHYKYNRKKHKNHASSFGYAFDKHKEYIATSHDVQLLKKMFGQDLSDIVPEEMLEFYETFLRTKKLYPKMLKWIAMVNNMKEHELVNSLMNNGFVKRKMKINAQQWVYELVK